MTLGLGTFLSVLYTIVDDFYQQHDAPLKTRRPGSPPGLSDSEVLTLAICAQWHASFQRAFIRYAAEHWRSCFPQAPQAERLEPARP